MTIDPRIPTMPGRSTSDFTHQADKACTKREAPSGVRRVARRVNCIVPRTARNTDSGALCLLSCLWMKAPMSDFVPWCGYARDSNRYHYVTASWVQCHTHTTVREGILPPCSRPDISYCTSDSEYTSRTRGRWTFCFVTRRSHTISMRFHTAKL